MKLRGPVLEQVAAAYAAGALGRLARRRFESILARDALARHAWQQWEQRLAQLTPAIPTVRPSDQAWRQIEAELTTPARAQVPRWWWWAAVVLGATLAWLWLQISR